MSSKFQPTGTIEFIYSELPDLSGVIVFRYTLKDQDQGAIVTREPIEHGGRFYVDDRHPEEVVASGEYLSRWQPAEYFDTIEAACCFLDAFADMRKLLAAFYARQ